MTLTDAAASPPPVRKMDTSQLKADAGLRPYEKRLPRMKKSGREYKALCPFHPDRNPSFSVYEKDNEWRFKCFGCHASGDVIEFVMQSDGIEFPEALKEIADKHHVGTKHEPKAKHSSDDQPKQPRSTNVDFHQEKACAALAENQDALEYLATRGITKEAALNRNLGAFDCPGIGPCIAIPYPTGDVKFRAIRPQDKGRKFRAIGKPNDKLYGIEFVDDILVLAA